MALLKSDLHATAVTFRRYVRADGEVSVQKNLSRDRPGYRAFRVDTPTELIQIVCRNGVVWGLTSNRNIIFRVGVSETMEEGSGWAFLQGSEIFYVVHLLVEVTMNLLQKLFDM